MELDDPAVLAALLRTARAALRAGPRPSLDHEASVEAERAAEAIALVARAREAGGIGWSRAAGVNAGGSNAARAHALRARVRARLAVTNPGYPDEVAGAPP